MESAAPSALYVVDTSVWIDLVPFRPPIFVSLWARIDALVSDGRLVVPEEVDREFLYQVLLARESLGSTAIVRSIPSSWW